MENEIILDVDSTSQNNRLVISRSSFQYLNEIGKWGKFLSIVGFCFIGLFVVIGLTAGTVMSFLGQEQSMPFPGFVLGLIYIAMGLLYFFPVLYLFNFSRHMKTALTTKSNQDMDAAFDNLKSHYKYIGIFMIVVLSLYALAAGGMLMVGSSF